MTHMKYFGLVYKVSQKKGEYIFDASIFKENQANYFRLDKI